MKDYRLVYVVWADSIGVSASWCGLDDISVVKPHYCHSVGWVVKKGKEAIVIVPHISPSNKKMGIRETGCGDMTIPRSAIVTMTELKPRVK